MEKSIKIRRLLERLEGIVSPAKQPLILIYGNPDPDALASAWALETLLRSPKRSPRIRYTGQVGRLENQAMVELLGIPVSVLRPRELEKAELIAVVDAQPAFFHAPELPRCDIAFDHHPLKSATPCPFQDIRPTCLATSSILTAYLREAGVRVTSNQATALYYGIQSDWRHMQGRPTATDREALRFLEQLVDMRLLQRIEASAYTLASLDYFGIGLIKLRHAGGVLYTHLGRAEKIGQLRGEHLARLCLRPKTLRAEFISEI